MSNRPIRETSLDRETQEWRLTNGIAAKHDPAAFHPAVNSRFYVRLPFASRDYPADFPNIFERLNDSSSMDRFRFQGVAIQYRHSLS